MKVLFLSTSDIQGGAARAAHRLYQGLLSVGVDVRVLVQSKSIDDPRIIAPSGKIAKGLSALRPTLDLLPLYLTGEQSSAFATSWLPSPVYLHKNVKEFSPDIIHLHWVNKGFLHIESLSNFNVPIVWTLHDMWAFTGGCQMTHGCEGYQNACGSCPQLKHSGKCDLSHWIFNRKLRAWSNINLTLACPSRWISGCVSESSLFKSKSSIVIPNGLDLSHFCTISKGVAREILNLPLDKHLILFSAVNPIINPYKGFNFFLEMIDLLRTSPIRDDLEVVILGIDEKKLELDLPFPTHYPGYFHDEISLGIVNAAVDLIIAPSIQDNLPLTVMEALACGTPCVGFRVGGIPDMVTHQENGYLVEVGDVQGLADGVVWVLEDPERWERLSKAARKKAVDEYDQVKIAKRYLKLYESLLRNPKGDAFE
jgi:glycosyltransferase involved in cell wall biosynthesis